MKKAEKEHLDAVTELGCIVCRNETGQRTASQIHHVRMGKGLGQRASHFETIPLCHWHHQNGPIGVAFHAGRAMWEWLYGTEEELLEQVTRLLEATHDLQSG